MGAERKLTVKARVFGVIFTGVFWAANGEKERKKAAVEVETGTGERRRAAATAIQSGSGGSCQEMMGRCVVVGPTRRPPSLSLSLSPPVRVTQLAIAVAVVGVALSL